MKKFLAIFAFLGLTLGMAPVVNAQEDTVEQATEIVEVVETPAATAMPTEAPAEEGGAFKELKQKFIEGDAFFMSFVVLALILGMAFIVERIIYLNLAEINPKKLIEKVEDCLERGDVDGALEICRNTRGPIASIFVQGLMRIDQGIDVVERSVVAYGGVQAGQLEKGLSWITLFIAMAPSLGFMGTVIGMIQAFDKIMNKIQFFERLPSDGER